MVLKVATDCSGIEAPIQALMKMGVEFEHMWSCDNDKWVKQQIEANYHPKTFYDDISTRDHSLLPHVDLYVAGFPCQPFSTQSNNRMGFNDTRGNIFFECLNTIKASRPKCFVLENVMGLLSHDNKNTFRVVTEHLNQLDEYIWFHKVLNAVDYNSIQNRKRIFIVGFRKDTYKGNFTYPDKLPLTQTVDDILDSDPSDEFYYRMTTHKQTILDKLIASGKISDPNLPYFANLNTSFERANNAKLGICPTILAAESGAIYYLTSRKRRLTKYETMRLQGFDPSVFRSVVPRTKLYKQIGNSINVNVLVALFSKILEAI